MLAYERTYVSQGTSTNRWPKIIYTLCYKHKTLPNFQIEFCNSDTIVISILLLLTVKIISTVNNDIKNGSVSACNNDTCHNIDINIAKI